MAVTPEETLATLRRQSAAARQQAAARETAIRERAIELVGSRLPPSARVWLIGSLAWGGFGERSDVDLVFDGLEDRLVTEIEIELTRALEIPVDTLRLADLPTPFRDRVQREGLLIHGG
jgi:predicted nucleotidyltransferase